MNSSSKESSNTFIKPSLNTFSHLKRDNTCFWWGNRQSDHKGWRGAQSEHAHKFDENQSADIYNNQ